MLRVETAGAFDALENLTSRCDGASEYDSAVLGVRAALDGGALRIAGANPLIEF
jgi:hypothetical protein